MKTPHLPWIVAWLIVLAGGFMSEAGGAWWKRAPKDESQPLGYGQTTAATPTLGHDAAVTYTGGSAMSKITTGTKQVMGGAVDLITLKPIRQRLFTKQAAPTPWQSKPQPWNPQTSEKKTSFFSSLFKSKEPPKKPATVNEFLAQPKPQ